MALLNYKPLVKRESPYSLPLLSAQQLSCLNSLVGAATCDKVIEQRLVIDRDEKLMRSYQIDNTTLQYIKTIEASTLEDFCIALHKLQSTMIAQ